MYVVKSCRQNLDRKMEFVLAIQSDYWWRIVTDMSAEE